MLSWLVICPWANSYRKKVKEWFSRAGETGGKWVVIANEYSVPFWSDKNVLKLIMVVGVQLCEYTKNHWIVHLNR